MIRLRPLGLVSLVLVLCAPLGRGQGAAAIVGGGRFATVQAAVDAAPSGSTILVAPGDHGPVTIDGKSLDLVGVAGPLSSVDSLVIRNLGPRQIVCVLDIECEPPTSLGWNPTGWSSLKVESCAGFVRLQGVKSFNATIEQSPRVSLARCEIAGWPQQPASTCIINPIPSDDGPDAITASDAVVALYGCQVRGSAGERAFGETAEGGGDGGTAYAAPGASGPNTGFFASGTSIVGGAGGAGCADLFQVGGGCGGDGLFLGSTLVRALLLDCVVAAGEDTPNAVACTSGSDVSGPGLPELLPGAARGLTAPGLATDAGTLTVTVTGVPGDAVRLTRLSRRPDFVYRPENRGVWQVRYPAPLPTQAQGIIPRSGVLELAVPVPPVQGVVDRWFLQGLVTDANGDTILTTPHTVIVLPGDSIDCNANGLVDSVEIATGMAVDFDDNGVPDDCEATELLVDANAAPGGDGSPASPFQTIDDALAVAIGHSVLSLADGVYTGPANRGLEIWQRSLTLRSVNGPAACILDCEGQDQALRLRADEIEVVGLTIRNGAAGLGGGIAVASESSGASVRNCWIRDCHASSGGAIWTFRDLHVSACEILDNSASFFGGGIYVKSASVTIDNCLVAGNRIPGPSGRGGGIFVEDTSIPGLEGASLRIRCSTLSGNHAALGGGLAARSTTFEEVGFVVENSIVYGNDATAAGWELHLDGLTPLATFYSSNVFTGPNALSFPAGTLVDGGGNVTANPVFVSWAGSDGDPGTAFDNDYRLLAASPCLDAGDNTRVPPDTFDADGDGTVSEPIPYDVAGQTRLVDSAAPDVGVGPAPIVDIGAYERQQ